MSNKWTYKEAAKQALAVQDACNLSGVVFSFATAMQAICDESVKLGKGTDWKNANPIVTLFLSKLSDLNGSTVMMDVSLAEAHRQVEAIANGNE